MSAPVSSPSNTASTPLACSAPQTRKPSRNRCKGFLGEAAVHKVRPHPIAPRASRCAAGSPELARPATASASPQSLGGRGSQDSHHHTSSCALSQQTSAGAGSQDASSGLPRGAGRWRDPWPAASIGQPAMNAPLSTQCMDIRRSAQRIWSIASVGCAAQRLHARVRPRLEPGRTHIGCTQQCAASNRPGSAARCPFNLRYRTSQLRRPRQLRSAVDAPPPTAAPSSSHSAVTDSGATYLAGPAAAAPVGPSRTHRFVADIWL